ncbi:MAG: hypothetical protein GEU68_12315 [Actinobacteria bacterium]|nr:hypothetical protein [Actinomycetota bacterium]
MPNGGAEDIVDATVAGVFAGPVMRPAGFDRVVMPQTYASMVPDSSGTKPRNSPLDGLLDGGRADRRVEVISFQAV